MIYWTWAEIKDKVERDLDLQDETFIQDEEMLGYANEAIDEAEAEILTLYEDYFLTSANLALVTGTSEYSLPSDIYATKIRSIIYRSGSLIFPITKIKEWNKFEAIAFETTYPATQTYKYILKNPSAAAGYKIVLYPPAMETSASNVTIWYIRNANRLTSLTDTCDIPEFVQFVIQYIKVRCYEKEGHPNLQFAVQALEKQRSMMVQTLGDMIPDGDSEIQKDFSYYEEMS